MPEKPHWPKFPDLPWSTIEKGSFIPLRAEDVSSRADVEDLMVPMFEQAETVFYLYTTVGEPAPVALLHAENRGELLIPKAERPYYLHKAGNDHSFSQIEEASPDGVEYQQVTLKLTEKGRDSSLLSSTSRWRKRSKSRIAFSSSSPITPFIALRRDTAIVLASQRSDAV